MRQNILVKIIFLLLTVMLLKTSAVYGYVSGPNSARECAICHFNWIDVFYRKGQSTDLVEYPKEKAVATEMMCYSCHDGSVIDSRFKVWETNRHKPGTKPSKKIKIPRNFPLDSKGRLQCATCHSAHGVDTRPGIEKTIFLRASSRNSAICRMCHFDKSRGVKKGSHPVDVTSLEIPEMILKAGGKLGAKKNQVICQTCHEPHGSTSDHFLVIPNSGKGITHSALCETCHTKKPDIKEKSKRRQYSHPMDVRLMKEARLPERWENGEKPYLSFDGRINCRTCHSPHNGTNDNHLLVDSNVKGRFCLYCHTSKKVVEKSKHNLSITAPEARNIDGKDVKEKGVCSACHLMHKGTGPKMWARKLGPGRNNIEKLCTSCHKKKGIAEKKIVGSFSHPVGRDISALGDGVKTDLPLYTADGHKTGKKDKGMVVCTTCHNPHQWDPTDPERTADKDEEGDGSNSFLRKQAFIQSDLCIECHSDKLTVRSTKHDLNITGRNLKNIKGSTIAQSGVCGGCHLPHNGEGPKMWARKLGPGKDKIERLCTSCHKKGGLAKKKVVGKNSHPVGRDISALGDGVKTDLPLYTTTGIRSEKKDKGMVECGTCHNPHRWDPSDPKHTGKKDEEGDTKTSFLRKTANNKSKLCTSCHKNKAPIIGTKHDLNLMAKGSKNVLGESPLAGGVCSGCHVPHNGEGPKMWARKPYKEKTGVESLCRSCHRKEGLAEKKVIGKNSHPVDRDISVLKVKTDLPLYSSDGGKTGKKDKGMVECGTCHNPHRWDPTDPKRTAGKDEEGDGSNSFLRISVNGESDLCIECHKQKIAVKNTKHDMNLMAKGSKNVLGESPLAGGVCSGCHVPHNGEGPKMWARKPYKEKTGVESLCRSCHRKEGLAEKKVIGKNSHPVDRDISVLKVKTDLPLYSSDGGKTGKKDKGMVECGTCHNPHRWDADNPDIVPDKEEEGNATNSFLRVKASPAPSLCIGCHNDKRYILSTEHDLRITAPDAENAKGENILESGVCGQCHSVHNASGNLLLWAMKPGYSDDPMEQLCRSCHSDNGIAAKKQPLRYTHPRDVLMVSSDEMKREEGKKGIYFPLYDEDGTKGDAGYISCPTCHNPHRWSPFKADYGPGKNTEGSAINSFLRNKSETALCTDCHGLEGLFRYKYFHGEVSREPYPITR